MNIIFLLSMTGAALAADSVQAAVSVEQLDRITWKAMPAYRYVARGDSAGEAIVRESVIAMTRHGDDTLVLYIQAPQKQYDGYRAEFGSMLRSWRASAIE